MTYIRTIVSFARRIGRPLSDLQKSLLKDSLPNYLFNPLQLQNKQNLVLEIGFGNGGHIFTQASNNPQNFYIGAEVYFNGIANLLKLVHDSGTDLPNLRIFPEDINQLLPQLEVKSLEKIYVLFADPWPKKKHHKRRLINVSFLEKLSGYVKDSGELVIATDHLDYAEWIWEELQHQKCFELPMKSLAQYQQEPKGWVKTNYQMKAEMIGVQPYFFVLAKPATKP